MEVIDISEQNLNNLKVLKNSYEAILYLLTNNLEEENVIRVIKRFKDTSGQTFGNKLYTLNELLSETIKAKLIDLPFAMPQKLVTINGNLEGYLMPYIQGPTLKEVLDDPKLNNQVKLKYLADVGLILEGLKEVRINRRLPDLFLGDLNEGNILVNKRRKKVLLVDTDSIKINGNKPSDSKYLSPSSLASNIPGKYNFTTLCHQDVILPDENSDLYCYNVLVLNMLFGGNVSNMSKDEYNRYLEYLINIGISDELVLSFLSLVSFDDNVNPMSYIERLTDKQLLLAKEEIYI